MLLCFDVVEGVYLLVCVWRFFLELGLGVSVCGLDAVLVSGCGLASVRRVLACA